MLASNDKYREFRERWGIRSQKDLDEYIHILEVVQAEMCKRSEANAIKLLGLDVVLAVKANQTES